MLLRGVALKAELEWFTSVVKVKVIRRKIAMQTRYRSPAGSLILLRKIALGAKLGGCRGVKVITD